MSKNSTYIVRLDLKIAGAIGESCPQKTIGCSLAKFIEVQYNALKRERNELICQDCIVSLPVEIVDTLDWLYPNLPFSDQVINAVRTLVDLSTSDALQIDSLDPVLKEDIAYYRSICDMQRDYAYGSYINGDEYD